MTDKTLLFQLREAARVEYDELVRFNLKHAADQLDDAVTKFAAEPTQARLIDVNGFWAHGVRMLDNAGRRKPRNGGNGAGLKEGALLAAVA